MTQKISAVICTHNRAAYLSKALKSLERQTLSKSQYEVIVVDNCSSDGTRDLVAQHMRARENIRYLFEPNLGLSLARNQGLREARGTYIAFLDDDAVADHDWLEWGARVFDEQADAIGFLGGKVRPIWESERPEWLSDDLLPYLSVADLGDLPLEVEGTSGLVGANMVFKTEVLRDAGGFPQALGRKGKNLLSNEELQLKSKLQEKGLKSLYHPKVAVSHHVIESRLTKRWFRRRLYWQGRSDAILWRTGTDASNRAVFFKSGTVMRLVAESFFYWLRCLMAEGSRRMSFSKECVLLLNCGYLFGLLLDHNR